MCNYYRYLTYLYRGTVLPVQERTRSEAHVKQPVPTIQIAEGFSAEDISYDLLDEEFKMIIEDLDSDQADWTRSSEEGWPYSDQDNLFY